MRSKTSSPPRLAKGLLALAASTTAATLPYNPTRIIVNDDGTIVYLFRPNPSTSQFSLLALDVSSTISSASQSISTISPALPFLSSNANVAFTPVQTQNGDIIVLAGDCSKAAKGLELWRFNHTAGPDGTIWSEVPLSLYDNALGADFLSAAFSFSPTSSDGDDAIYVFGGMCPNAGSISVSNWIQEATYSDTMLTLSASADSGSNQSPYQLSLTGQRAPPIPEAGLTITPLTPSFTNTSAGNISEQRNFVLIGGHTMGAFINMSQVALFTLPQQSWAFLGIDQPAASSNSDLAMRSVDSVDPRSGHTAILSPDGSQVIVFGGWVGDINTPAEPQLAILEIGQGYGGTGDWAWTIPSQVSNPFASGRGIYGHGATLLPGGVMMISGGYKISGSNARARRDVSDDLLFFNTTSSSWIQSYSNPNSPDSPTYVPPKTTDSNTSSGLGSTAKKAGLGFGIAIAILAVIGIMVFWYMYRKRLRKQRSMREKELRELALGAERYNSVHDPGRDSGTRFPEMRSSSWGSRQEQMIGDNEDYPWAPVMTEGEAGRMGQVNEDDVYGNGLRHAERTGLLMDLPSPNRGLRRSLHSRGPLSYGANFGPYPGGAPSVFRIDEEEENSTTGSLRRGKSPTRKDEKRISDPFKDPPEVELEPDRPSTAAEERAREVQGWVDDWRAAEETILSRNTSKATTQGRTYSNLSHSQSQSNSHSHSGGVQSGRGSPEKSDRTGSNLSEASMMSSNSIQRSNAGTVSRNISQRSTAAGYALFAGAAAAMAARIRGSSAESSRPPADYGTADTNTTTNIAREPSHRSASLNLNSSSSSNRVGHASRPRGDTFSTARTSLGHTTQPNEDSLLLRTNSRALAPTPDYYGNNGPEVYATPPESPVKKTYIRTDSFGSQAGRRALGFLGSVKRVLTGTGSVAVKDRVAALEGRSTQSSPTKHHPEMAEVDSPRRTISAGGAFWAAKQGRRDWEADYTTNEISRDTADTTGIGERGISAAGGTVKRKRSRTAPGLHRKPVANQTYQDNSNASNVIRPSLTTSDANGEIEDDWDVEDAVQRRVVQVMFTVPKEKLRVVNADALSMISRSEVGSEVDGGEDAERERQVKRMSSVREGDEGIGAFGVGSGHDGVADPPQRDISGGGGASGNGNGGERVLVQAEDIVVQEVVVLNDGPARQVSDQPQDPTQDLVDVARFEEEGEEQVDNKGKQKYVFSE